MIFANPAWLKMLPLALLPLALHLFYPRRRRVVQFAPFMLLNASRRHPAIRRRLREMLLLMLRMLAIAAAILAMARPHLRSVILGNPTESGAVIVLDDTMSMQRSRPGGGSAFEQARATALAMVDALPPECRIGLVCSSGAPGLPLTGDRRTLHDAINAAQQTGCSGSLREAVIAASTILQPVAPGGRQFVLLSDFQENALPAGGIEALKNAYVYGQSLATPEGNCSIARPAIAPLPKAAGLPLRIAATVTNHGPQPREIHLRLEINGIPQEERLLTIPGDDSLSQEFIFTPATAGDLAGRLTIDDDEISLDNAADFQVTLLDQVPVLLIEDTAARSLRHFQEALKLLKTPANTVFRCQDATAAEAQLLSLDTFRIIAVAPSASTPAALAAPIAEYLRNGGSLMAFPATTDAASAQPFADSAFYAALAEALGTPPLFDLDGDSSTRVTESGMELFPPLQSWNGQLELNLIRWNHLRPPNSMGGRLLAASRNGPLVVSRMVAKGTMMIFGFLPSRSCGNWPELKSFPIMMLALADCALGNTERTLPLFCGEPAVLTGDSPQLIQADGHATELPGGQWNGSRLPGLTRFRNATCDVAIAMPPPEESDTACLEPDEAEKRLGTSVTWLLPGEDPATQLADLQTGTDTTGWLLLLVLAAVTAEFLLGLGRLRRGRKAP